MGVGVGVVAVVAIAMAIGVRVRVRVWVWGKGRGRDRGRGKSSGRGRVESGVGVGVGVGIKVGVRGVSMAVPHAAPTWALIHGGAACATAISTRDCTGCCRIAPPVIVLADAGCPHQIPELTGLADLVWPPEFLCGGEQQDYRRDNMTLRQCFDSGGEVYKGKVYIGEVVIGQGHDWTVSVMSISARAIFLTVEVTFISATGMI